MSSTRDTCPTPAATMFASRLDRVPATARHVVISVNPKAGARSGDGLIASLQTALEALDYGVTIVQHADELQTETAARLDSGDLRAVVCAGGDGTLAFVANAVPPAAPLAMLPLGTENLFSRYLGIAPAGDAVAEMIHEGRVFRFDAGVVQTSDAAGEPPSPSSPPRIFTLMAGVGFDADVVRRVHEARTGHIRHWAYAKPIWSTIRTYKYPQVRVTTDTGEEHRARWVFVANLPPYAANLEVVPDACGWNGKLTVCTFKRGSFFKGLQYLTAIVLRRHRDWKSEVRMMEVEHLRIKAEGTVSYQLDGDYGGELPIDIRVLPGRLSMVVPPSWVLRQQA